MWKTNINPSKAEYSIIRITRSRHPKAVELPFVLSVSQDDHEVKKTFTGPQRNPLILPSVRLPGLTP